MPNKSRKRRKFKGFAVLDRRGNLLWGTLRPEREESQALFDKWNPAPDDHPMGEQVVSIEIFI